MISERFTVGQVWRYETRPTEEPSRVIIGKIESAPTGIVLHVKLTGLLIENPSAPGGISRVMNHAPITEEAFSESVIELTNEVPDLDGFSEGYSTWLSEEDAGVFTLALAEVVETMEHVLNQ